LHRQQLKVDFPEESAYSLRIQIQDLLFKFKLPLLSFIFYFLTQLAFDKFAHEWSSFFENLEKKVFLVFGLLILVSVNKKFSSKTRLIFLCGFTK
jgi:hypothetical protein